MAVIVSGEIEDFKLPGGVAGRRRLAAFLAKAGEEGIAVNGQLLQRQEALAHLMWKLVLEGEVSFPDGRLIILDEISDWLSVAKFMFTHLDGPAVSVTDSKATNAVVRVVFGNEEPYPNGEPVTG